MGGLGVSGSLLGFLAAYDTESSTNFLTFRLGYLPCPLAPPCSVVSFLVFYDLRPLGVLWELGWLLLPTCLSLTLLTLFYLLSSTCRGGIFFVAGWLLTNFGEDEYVPPE